MKRQDTLSRLRETLLQRRDALRRALAGVGAGELEAPVLPGNLADRALDAETAQISLHMAEAESLELARVEHALSRASEGRYGLCERCGASIALARLEAAPHATLCIACQRIHDGEKAPVRRDRRAAVSTSGLSRRPRRTSAVVASHNCS